MATAVAAAAPHPAVSAGPAALGVGLRPRACWDCEFESRRGHGFLSVASVVCCQVQASATGRSLVQRRSTACGVSECDTKTSKIRKPRPTTAVRLSSHGRKKRNYNLFDTFHMFRTLITNMNKCTWTWWIYFTCIAIIDMLRPQTWSIRRAIKTNMQTIIMYRNHSTVNNHILVG
jgi:hypothetical protein